MASFRGLIRLLGPRWLVGDALPDGTETDSRAMYSVFTVLDALSTRLRLGMRAQYPDGNEPADALQYIGRDRRIVRGPDESATGFRARLKTARTDWKKAGGAWGLLSQIQGYCAPNAVKVRAVTNTGKWYTIEADGTHVVSAPSGNWVWDGVGAAAGWARFWIIIFPVGGTLPWAAEDTWGTGTWGDGGTWGTTATTGDVQAIRRIVSDWKMAGSRCEEIIIALDDTEFDPSQAAPPLPDGTWKWYGDGGDPTLPARNATGRYWPGTRP